MSWTRADVTVAAEAVGDFTLPFGSIGVSLSAADGGALHLDDMLERRPYRA